MLMLLHVGNVFYFGYLIKAHKHDIPRNESLARIVENVSLVCKALENEKL